MKFLFIGSGQMATAMIKGLHKDIQITVANKSNLDKLNYLKENYQVSITNNWKEEIVNHDAIVLAIPPNAHKEILAELAEVISGQLVITVAGGIGLQLLEEILSTSTPIAWVMPNTAAEIKQSISLFTHHNLTEKAQQHLQIFLNGIGSSIECTEEQIINLTAITGSAPAFVYEFASALIDVAKSHGVEGKHAQSLVAQMILGSASMLLGKNDAITLRNDVTSPGGSTAAGITTLENEHFTDLIKNAVHNTTKKAMELANE